jgi:hypothetical protein
MPSKTISINRAPVLTLWASVVAERLGYSEDEALSLGKALTGLTAQAKGRRLGIIHAREDKAGKSKPKAKKPIQEIRVEILGRTLPATRTDDGIRAVKDATIISPESARRYLESKFGDDLAAAKAAMQSLAKAYSTKELATKAFKLYEEFRPGVPEGKAGWGAQGVFDLDLVRELAKESKK